MIVPYSATETTSDIEVVGEVLPPVITPLKMVLVALAIIGGGTAIYYGLRGKKK